MGAVAIEQLAQELQVGKRVDVAGKTAGEFTGIAKPAPPHFAIDDDAAADTGGKVDVGEAPVAAPHARHIFTECGKVAVVVRPRRQAGRLRQQFRNIDERPLLQCSGRIEPGRSVGEAAGNTDAHAEEARRIHSR